VDLAARSKPSGPTHSARQKRGFLCTRNSEYLFSVLLLVLAYTVQPEVDILPRPASTATFAYPADRARSLGPSRSQTAIIGQRAKVALGQNSDVLAVIGLFDGSRQSGGFLARGAYRASAVKTHWMADDLECEDDGRSCARSYWGMVDDIRIPETHRRRQRPATGLLARRRGPPGRARPGASACL